jgi:hypothetical protein
VKLAELLEEKHDAILQRWIDKILKTYPEDSAGFLGRERNQFRNPVGHTIRTETETLLAALLHGTDGDELTKSLDRIVRLRNVQDMSPAQAVTFVFLLKTAIREELTGALNESALLQEQLELESQIDGLALAAFDNYMECKEAIYDIRAREARMQTAMLVRQVNRLYDQNLPEVPLQTLQRANSKPDMKLDTQLDTQLDIERDQSRDTRE